MLYLDATELIENPGKSLRRVAQFMGVPATIDENNFYFDEEKGQLLPFCRQNFQQPFRILLHDAASWVRTCEFLSRLGERSLKGQSSSWRVKKQNTAILQTVFGGPNKQVLWRKLRPLGLVKCFLSSYLNIILPINVFNLTYSLFGYLQYCLLWYCS